MSTTRARKPRAGHLLDGFPPDTRIVAVGVTWDDYENLVNRAGGPGTSGSPLTGRTSR